MWKPRSPMKNRRSLLTRSLALAAPILALSAASRGGGSRPPGNNRETTSGGAAASASGGTAARNKQLMTGIYQAVAHGDGSKFVEHLAEDAVFTVAGQSSWSGSFHGKDRIIRYFRLVAELAPGTRRTIPVRVLADEDWVVVEARGDMTSKSGVPYRNHYSLHYRLQDGMIREMMEFMDTAYCERVLGAFPADRMDG